MRQARQFRESILAQALRFTQLGDHTATPAQRAMRVQSRSAVTSKILRNWTCNCKRACVELSHAPTKGAGGVVSTPAREPPTCEGEGSMSTVSTPPRAVKAKKPRKPRERRQHERSVCVLVN